MPNRWQGCVKIHEGCGGVCQWVEAVEDPNVGYHGECTHCGEENIVVEQMIPLENVTHRAIFEIGPASELDEFEWDEDASWEENQGRLTEKLPTEVRRS